MSKEKQDVLWANFPGEFAISKVVAKEMADNYANRPLPWNGGNVDVPILPDVDEPNFVVLYRADPFVTEWKISYAGDDVDKALKDASSLKRESLIVRIVEAKYPQ